MAPISLNCEFPLCKYKTPEGDLATLVELLILHSTAVHSLLDREHASKSQVKVEKAKRPTRTVFLSQTYLAQNHGKPIGKQCKGGKSKTAYQDSLL